MKPLQRLLVFFCLLVCCSAHGQIITTVAGCGSCSGLGDGGQATNASLGLIGSVAIDSVGNVYIADGNNHRIRKVEASTGIITTVAGTGVAGYNGDGMAATATQFNVPSLVVLDRSSNLFIGDSYNYRIRKVELVSALVSTFAGTGSYGHSIDGIPANMANIYPGCFDLDSSGIFYLIDESSDTCFVKKINTFGMLSTIAGVGPYGCSGDGGPAVVAKMHVQGGMCADVYGNIYIADAAQSVRKIDAVTGIITRVAGTGDSVGYPYSGDNGPATAAHINPFGLAVDKVGNIFIADYSNNRVEVVDVNGFIHSIAGTGTNGYNADNIPATSAQLNHPEGVAVDKCGNIYVADFNNKRVRKITFNPNCWPLSVDSVQQDKPLTIYPNPATGTLHIDNLKDPATYTLYDITGRVVATSQLTTGPNELNTTHLSPGIYLLHLQHKDGTREVHKIVKE